EELAEAGYFEFYESEEGYRLLKVTSKGMRGVPQDAVTLKSKAPAKRGEKPQRDRAAKVKVVAPAIAAARQAEEDREPTPEEVDLFERLRAWRRVVANRLNLPPYIIFHDKTLWAIAKAHPSASEDLRTIKGVGQSHVDKYGPELL